MDTYVTLTISISPLMTQLLIKYGNIVLTTTTIPPVLWTLCPLLLVRLTGYIVNLSDSYSYSLIGKLTDFLEIQEFNLCNLHVDSSTSSVLCSLLHLKHV